MLGKRVITALLGVPLVFTLTYLGGHFLLLAILIIVFFILDEMFHALKKMDVRINRAIGILGSFAFVISAHVHGNGYYPMITYLVVMVYLLYYVNGYPKVALKDVGILFFTSLYVGYFLSYAILIRHLPNGLFFLLLVFILTWSADIGAYFTGSLIGRRKLAKTISPKKTLEGAAGGIVFPVTAVLLTNMIAPFSDKIISILFLGVLAGLFAQFGDLAASAIKRQANIKDFGSILPGHGGFTDRFDSFLTAAPMVYYYLVLFIIN
ncbi:MAG: phosphatidate cytidylyltransferase [Clostridia bacterium]|nr:phosphatidate cytidylyltransferase [Clostridia bacterium]